jgi:FixJ family two-component response regulator
MKAGDVDCLTKTIGESSLIAGVARTLDMNKARRKESIPAPTAARSILIMSRKQQVFS